MKVPVLVTTVDAALVTGTAMLTAKANRKLKPAARVPDAKLLAPK